MWYKRRKVYGDPLGQSLIDYHSGNKDQLITIYSDVTEYDPMDPGYFFRSYDDMPLIEKMAVDSSKGKVLDVGCGAGCHSLALMEKGCDVHAIDISPGSVEVASSRGVPNVRMADFFKLSNEKYDSILFLMNGLGIAGRIKHLHRFLLHCKSLLQIKGQIIIDSADLMHLYLEEDGSIMMNMDVDYYGEVRYQMEYRKILSKPFDWLYVDYYTLETYAIEAGLNCEQLHQGENYAYLARMTNRS